jgi:voltage-gated potassium channel
LRLLEQRTLNCGINAHASHKFAAAVRMEMPVDQPTALEQSDGASLHGNVYNLFIIILTVLSLIILLMLILPMNDRTTELLLVYDNLICVVFLFDFAYSMHASPSKRGYFIQGRGWLDLLGSIPSLGILRYTGLLRLARLSRLVRITRLRRYKNKHTLIEEVLQKRGQYAVFITLMSALTVLFICSVLVLQFESRSPDANITTGSNAIWWAVVTITTVGYGDYYPVTFMGRIIGVLVMVSGVGIIAALASVLTSIIIPPPKGGSEPIAGVQAVESAVKKRKAREDEDSDDPDPGHAY